MATAERPPAAVLADAFAASPLPSCVVDMDGPAGARVLHASDSLVQLLGRPAGELEGAQLAALLTRAPGRPSIHGAVDFDREGGGLWVAARPDGARATVELHVARFGDSARNLRVVQLVDVSARETAQRSLREAVRRLQDIVDNSSALVFVKDLDGRYMLANRCFERRFGLLTEDILGRTDTDLFAADVAAAYQAHDREVLETAQPLEVEERAEELGQTWLSIKFPLLDERGRPYALGGISTDITERLAVEAAARRARDEAQRADRAKTDFLSRMSHELRTPLNAILGFGQLLSLESLSPRTAESVDGIMAAGRHLLALIDEVLDLSRIEAGALRSRAVPVQACTPLREAIELVRPLARERDIELAVDLHGGLYRHVHADPQGLRQALLNLLANAVQYTPRGGAVRAAIRAAGDGALRYTVLDTGPGLTESEQGRIFAPFERLESTRERTVGSGLGLGVARALVEAMGGTLGIQHSAPGEGSTFYVQLALTASDDAAGSDGVVDDGGVREALAAGPRIGPARVLCIEDDPSNLEVVRRILGHAGEVEVLAAGLGADGIARAVSDRPDLVLLDLHLPDVAGETVLRSLGEDPRTRAIPVIVLSADATPDRRRAAIADGARAYVTKPLDVGALLAELRRALAAS